MTARDVLCASLTMAIVGTQDVPTTRQIGSHAHRRDVDVGGGEAKARRKRSPATRSTARALMVEGRRFNELMGSVNILPQLLASLGVIFTAAKLGDFIASAELYGWNPPITCSSSCLRTASA